MAAAVVRLWSSRSPKSILKHQKRFKSNQYYVLLPEVPPDTADTNAIMQSTGYPQYHEITPEQVVTGGAKLCINHEVQMGNHLESLKDHSKQKTFEGVFHPIEEISIPLSYGWRLAMNLNYTCGGDYHTAFQKIHPRVERARNELWVNQPLYLAIKEVNRETSDLTEFQQRMIDIYLMEARLNGIENTGKDRTTLLKLAEKLVDASKSFRNKVMVCHKMFSHIINNPTSLEELPKHVLTAIAADRSNPGRGPWRVTLNAPVYEPMMEHCTNRMIRWNMWAAYNGRAGMHFTDQNLSNTQHITDIRSYRKDIAKILGYENFAQMAMETKMAGSVENVVNMIESLKSRFKPVALEELIALENFAKEQGFQHDLEMWDVPYWRRRMKEHLFSLDPSEIAEYFPMPSVLKGLFQLCATLFGVRVEDCTGQVATWHDTVQFYKIYDERGGPEIAAFYVDPYSRPGKIATAAWMQPGREYSSFDESPPFSYLNLNLIPPLGSDPALMTLDQVKRLFQEFGHGLQQMLTRVPYSHIAGQRNIEWDALQVCANVMSMLLHKPQVLQTISCHVHSGKSLPTQMLHNILKSERFLSSYDTMKQLYFSALDMEMYVSHDPYQEIINKVWHEFLPLPLSEDDQHVCSFTAIFSDRYPAAYYSNKWSEMIAADVFGAFEEAEMESPEKVAHVGRRFRETFLELGGGIPASEVFRRFRGRDPSQDALIRHYGLE